MDYERTVRAARWMARNLPVQCPVDWQDLAQESALEQLRGRKSVTGPMLDALRRTPLIGRSRPSERKDLRQADMPELSIPPHNTDGVEAERLLMLAPGPYRIALRMYFWDGMSETEIAERLRLPLHLTRWRVHEGKRIIRRRLGLLQGSSTAAGSRPLSQPTA